MTEQNWIDWPGGECPVPPTTIIDIRLLNGDEILGQAAGVWIWEKPRVEVLNGTLTGTFYNGGAVAAYREVVV